MTSAPSVNSASSAGTTVLGGDEDPGSSARPGKTARLRSWYMTPETASQLAKAVDDLHFATRAPKYEVLAAIVRAGLADLQAIETELRTRAQ